METEITSGKWYIDSKDETKAAKIRSTIHKEGKGICLVYPNKEWEANAELIIEAPKLKQRNKQLTTLLRSAKRVIKELHHEANGAMGFHFWDEYQQNPFMKRINKAIDGK